MVLAVFTYTAKRIYTKSRRVRAGSVVQDVVFEFSSY